MNKCLAFGDCTWCDSDEICDVTDDPRHATCSQCLERAASYGAAAAMRFAAIEAGATRDPELVRERDEAIRRLGAMQKALGTQGAFFCNDCLKLYKNADCAFAVGDGLAWCKHCAIKQVPT